MPGAQSMASRIAQAMSSGEQPPNPGDPAPAPAAPTTLTPEYQAKNKDDLATTFKTNPDMDYNSKLRSFFGFSN